ncbi:DUF5655 domain-containing protein [Fulvivirgaceae bacterium BMA10]|uniref:DUF5655 domain-containing protein n=1 Tax=Splendidivirga corallicola TaxID=3051826 RepID=A0ABT8KW01_9BACT|nr:DUF5655 domain-containing protein [Fulvivirgaceae bacterium BMA10]
MRYNFLALHSNLGNLSNMWTCPQCKRTFRNTNQAHSCKQVDKESFFLRRPAHLKKLYDIIKEKVNGLGEFREEAVLPDVIFFKTKSTFLAIKVKKAWLDIEFFLDHLEDVHPVKKYLQTSKRRFVHLVSIDDEKEIDHQLMDWISHSYKLIKSS